MNFNNLIYNSKTLYNQSRIQKISQIKYIQNPIFFFLHVNIQTTSIKYPLQKTYLHQGWCFLLLKCER